MELNRLLYSCIAFFFDQGKVNKRWDAELNLLLDKLEDGEIMFTCPYSEILIDGNKNSVYTLNLEGHEIWITNFPYSFGNSWKGSSSRSRLPSVRTRWRLKNAIIQNPIFVTSDKPNNSDELVMLRFKTESFYV